FPNTVKVTVRRDSSANGALTLFFAPVVGTQNISLTASAAATIYGGTLDNLPNNLSINLGVLPNIYDVSAWDNFLKTGRDPDGNTTTDSSGNPEIQIYPSTKYKGNFGWLSLNDSHMGASTIADWIGTGMSQQDVKALQTAGL